MDDASLEDFLEADGSAAGDPEDDGEAGEGDGDGDAGPGDAAAPTDAVDPAATTYQWAPGGADCAVCGRSVERRWRAEAGLVCPDCKEW